jgi:hypothetical protein
MLKYNIMAKYYRKHKLCREYNKKPLNFVEESLTKTGICVNPVLMQDCYFLILACHYRELLF